MAQRRMFSKNITDSDMFLDMPLSSQALYFHLGMQADDDGFVTPKRILRTIGATADDLKILITKNYAIPFDSGVIVLTHWNENNYLQKDRYKGTIYLEEKNKLLCIQNVYTLDTQVRIGKVGKVGKVGRLQEPKKNSELDLIRDRFNFKK